MRNYYYLSSDGRIIRVSSKTKPSSKSIPDSGAWRAQEFDGKGWYYPVISEVTWDRLARLQYIGSVRIPKITGLAE